MGETGYLLISILTWTIYTNHMLYRTAYIWPGMYYVGWSTSVSFYKALTILVQDAQVFKDSVKENKF